MRRLAHIAALVALVAVAYAAPLAVNPSARAQDAAPPTASKSASTEVSGLDVTARKTVTEVDGLDVTVTRKEVTEVDAVEVKGRQTCLPPRSPADKDVPAPKLVSTYPAQGQTPRWMRILKR